MSAGKDIEVIVPQVGEAVSELTLVKWLKREGDTVTRGDSLFELDTEKMVLEIEAFVDGLLKRILAADGSEVEQYQVVGLIEVPA